MGRELGRISGPLLAENLLRNGNNLAFDTDLLYLDVVDRRIGFKTDAPVRTLTVNSTARTDYLIAPNGNTEAGTFNLGFTSYQINNLLGNIVLAPNPASDPTVATPRIGTSELLISTSLIKNIVNNHDINLDAATGRQVIFTTDTLNIGGKLHATGDITWDGNITFGNVGDEDDTVTFYSRVASSIIPDADSTYDLGRASPDRWRHLYTDNLDVSALIGVVDITITNLTVDGPGILRNNVTFPDNVVFNSTITNSLIPVLDNTYKIGTSTGPKRWKTVFLTGLDVGGVIDIRNNRITTLDFTGVDGGTSSLTGSILDGGTSFGASPDLLDGGLSSSPFSVDLQLEADTTGRIYVSGTDLQIDQNLTVEGNTVVTDVGITGQLDLTGDWNQTGTTQRTGDTDITGSLTVNGANTVQFQEVKFVSNRVTTTTGTNNLELQATNAIVKTLTIPNAIGLTTPALTELFFRATQTSWEASGLAIGAVLTDNTQFAPNTTVVDVQGPFTDFGQDYYIIFTSTLPLINFDQLDSIFASTSVGTVKTLLSDVEITNDLDVLLTGYTNTVNVTTVATADDFTADSIYIVDNKITTNTAVGANTDLELLANGAGIIHVTTTDVAITNDLTVDGNSTLTDVNIGTLLAPTALSLTGAWNQTGAVDRTGDTDITGFIRVNGANIVQFDNIKFDSNQIVATDTDSDLIFTANGTGIVKVLTSDVEIDHDLDVTGDGFLDTVNVDNTVVMDEFTIDDIYINDNKITTNTASGANTDLALSANGSGIIHVTTTNVAITNDLTVDGNSTLTDVNIGTLLTLNSLTLTGAWNQTGTVNRTGDTDITGALTVNGANIAQFDNIKFDSNQIVATVVDSDLIFTANGTGIVKVLTSDVEIDHDLDVTGDGFFNTVNVDNTVVMDTFTIDDIYINDNKITTNTASGANTDLILQADGLGKIKIPLTDVVITNDLTVNSLTTLTDVNIGTVLTPNSLTLTGAWNQTGTIQRTGNTDITGSLTVNGDHTAQFENIKIINNRIVTTDTNSDLILEAIGAISAGIDGGSSVISIDDILDGGDAPTEQLAFINGGSSSASYDTIVRVINTDVQINNDLNVLLDITANSSEITLGVTAVDFNIGDLYIKNTISVVPGNTSLVLGATGNVRFKTSDVEITNNLTVAGPFTVNGTSDILYTSISGIVTQTGNIDQTGSTDIIGTLQADDDISITGATSIISVNAVKIDDNVISVTTTNSDLQFRASGTGGVALERYLKITNNEITNIFDSNNIELAFNNLILTEDGQNLIVESGDFYLADTLLDGDLSVILTPNGTGNVVINSNKAFAVAYGNNADRILKNVGEIRQNSITNVYEGKLGTGLVKFNNIYDTDGNTYITPELTPGANDDTIRFGIDGVVKASVDSTKLFSNTLYAGSVSVSGTTISTLNSSNELLLLPSGAGVVKFNNVSFIEDYITNNTNSALVLASTGTGYVKFNGNNGIVFPSGAESLRYTTPELGETRYNTEGSYLEIFNGTTWISASGTSNVATLDEIQAELDLWSLVLG